MKKLIYAILLSFAACIFFACGSDDNEGTYLFEYNYYKGKWYNVNNSDSSVIHFDGDSLNEYIYDRGTNALHSELHHGKCNISSNNLIWYYSINRWKYCLLYHNVKYSDNVYYNDTMIIEFANSPNIHKKYARIRW